MASIINNLEHQDPNQTGSQRGSRRSGRVANRPDPEFQTKINRLNEAFGTKTPVDLARKLSLTPEAIYSVADSQNIPPRWYLIASQHGISVDWLLTGMGTMRRGERPPGEGCLSADDFQIIPQLESKVSAGPEGEVIYEDVSDYYPFKRWWVEKMVGKDPERTSHLILIKVRGDSMSPTINAGEVVMIDTWEAERINIRTGQIYMIIMPDGSSTIKRLALSATPDGRLKLICMSDNVANYKPFEFDLDPGRPLKFYVIGRVRWAGKEFD